MMESDIGATLVKLVNAAEDFQDRRVMRDQLLREAGAKIGGSVYHQAKTIERIQLWLLAKRERPAPPGSVEFTLALALAYGDRGIGFERIKQILSADR